MALATTHHATGIDRNTAHKGRGAALNLEGRFEEWSREAFADGWRDRPSIEDEGAGTIKTVVTEERAKSIINRNDSPDIPFRYSLNPYRGCEHGCIYCFARPSHAYLGLSPGLDFETRLFAKTNAPELLRAELSRTGYEPDVIAVGVNTDAYQPCEKQYAITRKCLEVMNAFSQPCGLITKSALIERDIDLLADMARRNLANVSVSVTTLDQHVSRFMEPRTAAPTRRLQTIEKLAKAGIPVGVNVAPVVPFLTDHELEAILARARDAGASTAGYILLRLPWELKELFRNWLEQHFPLKAQHVMSRVNDMRGGADNDPNFGTRMVGEGIFARLLNQRFHKACDKVGLTSHGQGKYQRLDVTQFAVPGRGVQGRLF
ncbi:MAG: PA0069 family radical SAM protein [Betaproteobacteria bacterium]|nr:PA0069 family radical SAM protein [Betaproteobacteria bacterium]